jgi:hypothetical protein
MLTQAEAESLIAMEKRLEESGVIQFPHPGDQQSWKATSLDGRETFLMDVNRGRIRLAKCTYQERYRGTEILIRLDLAGPPHRNPDGEVIEAPHIHVYREGYADKWAMALPADRFPDTSDLPRTFRDFLAYCNVIDIPEIQASLQ